MLCNFKRGEKIFIKNKKQKSEKKNANWNSIIKQSEKIKEMKTNEIN